MGQETRVERRVLITHFNSLIPHLLYMRYNIGTINREVSLHRWLRHTQVSAWIVRIHRDQCLYNEDSMEIVTFEVKRKES